MVGSQQMKKFVITLGAAVAAIAVALAAWSGPATGSSISQDVVVSPNPADFTPRVTSGAVYKMVQLGGIMFAGGDFTQVKSANNASTFSRSRLFGFNPKSGGLTAFNATFNAPVWALATDGKSLWAGGSFTVVNGVPRTGLVKLNPYTGTVDTAFNARLNASVSDAAIVKGRLIVGGAFSKRLQAVNPATGGDTGYLKIPITGQPQNANSGPTKVFRFAVNPAGTRLAMVGTFTSVGGQGRQRAAMINLGTTSTTVSGWYSPLFDNACSTAAPSYTRDVDFSPDGTFFVIVTTGAAFPGDKTKLCDSASRWNTNDSRTTYPVWVNYTGGDTLLSVQVTRAAVYVQGHQRWMNNPLGRDSAGPGAVSRPGIASLNPHSGLAYSWNPTKDRGVGGYDLLLNAQGLWVGSDTTHIGGEVHERLALLPLP
jgi:hypothetical protein